MGRDARKVFQRGGTIGRVRDNDWVFPDQYISGHHAKIAFVDGQYLVEDTSTNGVFVNSPKNRIPRGEAYALNDGDVLFIDDYEVRVSLQGNVPSRSDSDLMLDDAAPGAEDTDPIKLLGLEEAPVVRAGPRAAALATGSPLSQHYGPPSMTGAAPDDSVPEDYDPFAADERSPPRRTPPPATPQATAAQNRVPKPEPSSRSAIRCAPPVQPNAGLQARDMDFAALLAAAGLESARISPDVSQQFGKIIRVVVSGLMDVLHARGKLKDEFRLRLTTFKKNDNNPLKFSANVEDALHNLLVKRNAAYLGPVEAFEDAFQDVRHHQMAMLAGMRIAFDAMLTEFEPKRLEKDFDAQTKSRSFLSASAKSRYWDLYCNRFRDMVKDADSSFRNLFGDEFAKAYEDQLARLGERNVQQSH